MSANENSEFLLRRARDAGIKDPRELSNFMGQMQVESGGFHRMVESTHYSPERLLAVFGPHMDHRHHWHDGRNGLTTLGEARAIASGGEQAIANAVYGGVWGAKALGNVESGDGWRYRGRGYVQLTGRDHYESMGRRLGVDLVAHPELAAEPDIAARIAITYWTDRVRAHGHHFDVTAATRDINGGENGLPDRRAAAAHWQHRLASEAHSQQTAHDSKALPAGNPGHLPGADHASPVGDAYKAMGALLNAFEPYARQAQGLATKPPESAHHPSMHEAAVDQASAPSPQLAAHAGAAQHHHTSSAPADVATLQRTLHRLGYTDGLGHRLVVDGEFGDRTRAALQSFQRDHGLEAHGAYGPKTHTAMRAAEAALVTSTSNPHHALFERTLDKVRDAEHARGIASGPHSARIAAALTTGLVRDGISRIDRVEFNADTKLVRAVQISPVRDEPGLNRATDAISSRQASTQSVAESSRQLHEVAVNVQAQRQDSQFTHARPVAAASPSLSH